MTGETLALWWLVTAPVLTLGVLAYLIHYGRYLASCVLTLANQIAAARIARPQPGAPWVPGGDALSTEQFLTREAIQLLRRIERMSTSAQQSLADLQSAATDIQATVGNLSNAATAIQNAVNNNTNAITQLEALIAAAGSGGGVAPADIENVVASLKGAQASLAPLADALTAAATAIATADATVPPAPAPTPAPVAANMTPITGGAK